MKKYAIIVAGGTGTRMKGKVPKQFMLLNGKPVIIYSIEAFYKYDPSISIILAIHPDYHTYWMQLCNKFQMNIPFQLVEGGNTRFDSVKNGLNLIEDGGFVAVHDAARPLINPAFISHLFGEARNYGSAIPGVVLNDTIRVVEGNTSHHLDRTMLRAIQTPQVFRVSELKKAYNQPFQPLFTDDASVMQSAGFPIHISEGKSENMKITHPQDIAIAEVLIKM